MLTDCATSNMYVKREMAAAGAAFVAGMQEVQRQLLRDEIAKHERLMAPEDSLGLGATGQDDEALLQRDALLRERGGISSLQPGDDADPDGDRVILAEFQRLGLVPNGADGNSREHWGHTDEDLHPESNILIGTDQYETANRRYLRYHRRKIRSLREQIAGPPPSTPPPRGPRVPGLQRTILRGRGLSHMREMLGSGARREQRLQHIAQAVEMHGSGAPNTRPPAQMLSVSAARVTRKPVTGDPHVGASAPTIIAGTGLTAPAPGYHYMATGELMKDPE